MIHLTFTGSILSASVLIGFTTALILFCSHFHQVVFIFYLQKFLSSCGSIVCQSVSWQCHATQIEGDRTVGKMSPLVYALNRPLICLNPTEIVHRWSDCFICTFIGIQVRLGTERGSRVVKSAIIGLYALTFAFGLNGSLPVTCIVSNWWMLKSRFLSFISA